MKLLSKQDIQKQKASERKSEIDQGMTLAKKVDELRETVSKESSNLAKFRIESLKTIHQEIDELLQQKNNLSNEVEQMKQYLKKVQEIIKEIVTICK